MSETTELQLNFDAITDIAEATHRVAVEKGWYDGGSRPFPEAVALFHSELSEALEDYRDGHPTSEIYYEDSGKPCGVPIELADVLIRIFDTCHDEGIPIARALAEKMAYNMSRPHRHGGKVC